MVEPKNKNPDLKANLHALTEMVTAAQKEASEFKANAEALHKRQGDLVESLVKARSDLFEYTLDQEHEDKVPEQRKLDAYKKHVQQAREEFDRFDGVVEAAAQAVNAAEGRLKGVTEVLNDVLAEVENLAAPEAGYARVEADFNRALDEVKLTDEARATKASAYDSASSSFELADTQLVEAQQRLAQVEKNAQSRWSFTMSAADVNVTAAKEALGVAQTKYNKSVEEYSAASREYTVAEGALSSDSFKADMLCVMGFDAKNAELQTQIDTSKAKISDLVSKYTNHEENVGDRPGFYAVANELDTSNYGAGEPEHGAENDTPQDEPPQIKFKN